MNTMRRRRGVCVFAWLAWGTLPAAHAGDITSSTNTQEMPSRISMSVTTPRQTQGKTFGESMTTGSQVPPSTMPPLAVECTGDACTIVFPDGSGYRADLQALALAPAEPSRAVAVRKEIPAASQKTSMVGQGASLVGAVMPGASIVSAAVSSVGVLANSGSGAAQASYAATGRQASGQAAGSEVDLSQPLADGDYQLAVVVEKATSGLKDTLKTNVRTAPPQQVRIVIGFSVRDGVMNTRHDTAKNSISNIR